MNRLILLAILACFGWQTATAQLTIVPKAGANFSYFSEDLEDTDLEGNVGFQVGLDLRVGDRFYFSPGVYYARTSNRVEIIDAGELGEVSVDFVTNGLRVPLVVGAKVIDDEGFALRLFGGATANLLFGEDDDLEDLPNITQEDSNWALSAGAGFDIGTLLTIDLRHDWGMSDFFELTAEKNRQNVFYLSAGVRF